MSLFRSSIRPPTILSDEAIERYVAAIRSQLDPDPLFRRRLRGHVLNEFVAAREGLRPGQRAVREMTRIGRAVLYASFVLGISVTGAMAASQQAAPGDLFYPVKRQIEEMRYHIVPEHLHDELAAFELAERIAELDRLAESGDWDAVERHAPAVERAYRQLVESSGGAAGADLGVAAALLERLPDRARQVVETILADLPGVGPGDNAGTPGQGRDHGGVPPGWSQGNGPEEPPGTSQGNGPEEPPGTSQGNGPQHPPADAGGPDETPKPDKTPKPEPAPKSDGTPKPAPTPPPHAGQPGGQSGAPGRSGGPAPSGSPGSTGP